MTDSLSGAVAIVTGASSGIGRATAIELAAAGAQTVVVARRTDALQQLADAVSDAPEPFPIAIDLAELGAPAQIVERTVGEFGRIDVVVNSAGLMLNDLALEADLDDWHRMLDLNLRALIELSHAAVPYLVEAAASSVRQVADLVNISSIAGIRANQRTSVYSATKFGVGAFSDSLRQELALKGVRVSVVEPGAVDTELFEQHPSSQGYYDAMFAEVEKLHPQDLGEEIAHIVTRSRRMTLSRVTIRPTTQV